MKRIIFLVFIASIYFSNIASGGNFLFYKELNLMSGYSDRDNWVGKSDNLSSSAGFEWYKKFSSEYGDFLTTNLQVRLAYDSSENLDNAWYIEIHNAWLEYKGGYGVNFKLGHFDPAFGLEPIVDTHGTMLQTLTPRNIGFKKDWGVALKGSLDRFDYKAAFQIGSGMSLRRRDGSFLATARLGTPATEDLQGGASILYGEVLKTKGMGTFPRNQLLSSDAVAKKRIGLDCQYNWSSFLLKGEAAYGADDDNNVLGYFLEADYTLPVNQNWQAKIQFQSWINDLGEERTDDSTLAACISYSLTQKITLRAAFFHDFNLRDGEEDNRFLAQFYYYGL